MTRPVPIGTAAELTGISAKMIRHYESLGLLGQVPRTDSGYRQYGRKDIHSLRFIRSCRDLGFSMADITTLLALWQDRQRASSDVRRIAQHHIDVLDARIQALESMRRPLEQLIACCHGDERPECPILEKLSSGQKIP